MDDVVAIAPVDDIAVATVADPRDGSEGVAATAAMKDVDPATVEDVDPATVEEVDPATVEDVDPATVEDVAPATVDDTVHGQSNISCIHCNHCV